MSCLDFDSVCDRESLAIVFDLGRRMCELDKSNNWSFLALSDFPIMTTGSLGWLGAQGGGGASSKVFSRCVGNAVHSKSGRFGRRPVQGGC